jgi:tetratricopeptide (TPR) repeat protein
MATMLKQKPRYDPDRSRDASWWSALPDETLHAVTHVVENRLLSGDETPVAATLERDLGHGDAALPLYEDAVAICRLEDDALRLAHAVRHLGDVHLDGDRLDRAEPCYREAVALYRAHPQAPPLDLANALRPLAMLEEHLGRTAQAVALWTEARDLYAAADVQAGVAESAEHLGRLGP